MVKQVRLAYETTTAYIEETRQGRASNLYNLHAKGARKNGKTSHGHPQNNNGAISG